jgi:hypothetical protein
MPHMCVHLEPCHHGTENTEFLAYFYRDPSVAITVGCSLQDLVEDENAEVDVHGGSDKDSAR